MRDRKEREERIEKRLEQRDENLMRMIREIQEAKRIMEEVAAAKEKKICGSFGDEYTLNRVYFDFFKRNLNLFIFRSNNNFTYRKGRYRGSTNISQISYAKG
ncbi:hypothetical protein IK3_05626 [Bacillus toyonensis]|nr:hypothetical protein IK3_05626 [Bacillus toyonensis]